MSDLGSQLRAAREAKGLTFEQVFKATRIKAPYLEALESNRIADLPGIVQARGFVRTYANFLGLDGETLASAIDTGSSIASMPISSTVTPRAAPIQRGQDLQGYPVGPAKPIEPAAAQPIVSMPAPTAKLDQSSASTSSTTGKLRVPTFSPQPAKPSSTSMGGVPTPILIAGAVVLFLIGAVLILTALAGAPKSPAPSSTLDNTMLLDSALSSTQSTAMSNEPASALHPQSGASVSLTLSASEHVWVRVTKDGQTAFEGMLTPNAHQQWTANEQIIVETGNAAALIVTCHDRTTVLGDRGQVVARAWSHTSIEDVPIAAPDHSADLAAPPTNIATTTIRP